MAICCRAFLLYSVTQIRSEESLIYCYYSEMLHVRCMTKCYIYWWKYLFVFSALLCNSKMYIQKTTVSQLTYSKTFWLLFRKASEHAPKPFRSCSEAFRNKPLSEYFLRRYKGAFLKSNVSIQSESYSLVWFMSYCIHAVTYESVPSAGTVITEI